MVTLSILLITVLMSLQSSLLGGSYNASLLLTWMGGHCKNLGDKCDKAKYEQWDHQSFTIHGLRLSRPTSKRYGDFDFNTLRENERLLDKMYNYWPPQPVLGGKPHFLWNYQWQKYGHRFAEMITIEKGKRYTSREYQSSFFTVAMQIYEGINVRKLNTQSWSKNQFSSTIGLPRDSFYFICGKDNVVTDIKICMTIDMIWSKLEPKLRKCGSNQKDTTCSFGEYFTLYDYQHAEIKLNPMSDEYFQELKDSNKLVYYPQEEHKQDDKIERIVIDTHGHDSHDSEIRIVKDKETLGKQRAQLEREAREEDYSNQEGFDQPVNLTQSQLIQIVKQWVIATSIVVSILWIALIVCALKCWLKMKKKKNVSINLGQSEMRDDLFDKRREEIQQPVNDEKAVNGPKESEGEELTIVVREQEGHE